MGESEYSPTTLFVRVTENCNAGCFMCDYARLHGKPFITPEQIEEIANEAHQSRIKLIRFTGGEPLTDKRISSYVATLHEQGFKTSIITNGYFLPQRAPDLINAGLDQIIVSLDASNAQLHNQLRNTPTLFEKANQGILEAKRLNPNLMARVNTVVSPYNIDDLPAMSSLLQRLDVDQWSIIPLKGPDNLWQKSNPGTEKWLQSYNDFKEKTKLVDRPRFLGYSKQWAGRNEHEAVEYFLTGIPYTPNGSCELVRRVRFYAADKNRLAACNCVPWRIREVDFNTDIPLQGLNDGQISPLVEYLNLRGPTTCTGCEPINAFLGEHPEVVDNDLFAF